MTNNIICKRPHIGVGVMVFKDGKVLLGKRIGSHGAKTWSFPGGKLDFGEDVFDCAERELLEEADIKVKNMRFGPFTNDYFKDENIHYVTLFVLSDYASGTVKLMEPDKCLEWNWFEWNKLPKPLFLPIQNLIKQKFNPFNKS